MLTTYLRQSLIFLRWNSFAILKFLKTVYEINWHHLADQVRVTDSEIVNICIKAFALLIFLDVFTWNCSYCNTDSQRTKKAPNAICEQRRHRSVSADPSQPTYRINGYCSVCQRTENTQIRLHRCARWSGPSVFAYEIRAIFHAMMNKQHRLGSGWYAIKSCTNNY